MQAFVGAPVGSAHKTSLFPNFDPQRHQRSLCSIQPYSAPHYAVAASPSIVSDSFDKAGSNGRLPNKHHGRFPASNSYTNAEQAGQKQQDDAWCFGEESVESALAAVRRGEFIVVVDDENRENEGDLIGAADLITPEKVAFMVRHTSGVICCAMEGERLDELALTPMVPKNTDPKGTAFTITCDLAHGISTGISAQDRALSLKALADPKSKEVHFNRPGHIFPLRYRKGGVLRRAGHTEAALDFSRLAGCAPCGVLAEIVNDEDGSMARLPQLLKFAKKHKLVLTSIADLVQYRRKREKLVERVGVAPARLPTRYGEFDAYAYRSTIDDIEHLALVVGGRTNDSNAEPDFSDAPVLVRVHSECCTGDVFGSLRCDCGPQLDFAMKEIAREGRGIIVYLRGQEGRGIGLGHKMRAYALQDRGRDTVEANEELGFPVDSREYGIGAQILADLGAHKLRVMTNNPAKYSGLGGYGLSIVERVPVQVTPNPENLNYLLTKKRKLGHWLKFDNTDDGPSIFESEMSNTQTGTSRGNAKL